MQNTTNKFSIAIGLMLFLFFFASCQSSSPFDETKLYGEWKVTEWKVLSTDQSRTNKMDMSFGEDGLYEVDYGSEKENGKFWISDEYLHTVETNQSEKKVKIFTLSKDSLFFQMNRGGELENVLLRRK